MELRDDPSCLAPERVIVFEIAGTIANFQKAVGRIAGLEFMAEYESDFAADEDFAVQDVRALEELLSLWERWERGEPMRSGDLRTGRQAPPR
jgi:hypothetical protein